MIEETSCFLLIKFCDWIIISAYWSCYRLADVLWKVFNAFSLILQYYICAISSAIDSRTGTKVAIKKLYRPFQSELFAKRAYRELRLLKHMKHENVRHTVMSTVKFCSKNISVCLNMPFFSLLKINPKQQN